MGTEKFYKCNKCQNKWSRYEGYGFLSVMLHCDKCGKGRSVSYDAQTEIPCKCGGLFKEECPVVCPKCHSTDVSIDGDVAFLWD